MKFARIAATALALAVAGSAAETNYMFIAGIQGSVTARGYENSIQVLSVSGGVSNSASAHVATGAGSGTADAKDLVVAMNLDKSWTPLMNNAFTGKVINSVELRTVAPGANGAIAVVRRIILTGAIVTDIRQTTVEKNGVPDHDVLQVSFSYQKIEWNWTTPSMSFVANVMTKS